MGTFRGKPIRHLAQQDFRPSGSDTRGLQNYDALYADVLLWEEKAGSITYCLSFTGNSTIRLHHSLPSLTGGTKMPETIVIYMWGRM